MISSVFLVALSLAGSAWADCSRDFLKNATAQYIAAQTMGQPSALSSLIASSNISSVNYTENFAPVDIAQGVLTQPLKIDHNISLHDPVECGTFTELTVANGPHPYVIGTRILYTNDTNKIALIESIVTDDGDWAFNATGYLYWESRENWAPIPEGQRDSRDVIKAAGDAYFERFHNASFVVPWGTPCARLEGGAYTGASNPTGQTCSLGLPSTITVVGRRYVVDEEMGGVDIFLGFPGLDRSQGNAPAPDSHMFRVEQGKIRTIHTVSSCVQKGCGLSGGPPPSLVV